MLPPRAMCAWRVISVELIFSLQAEFSPTRVSRFPFGEQDSFTEQEVAGYRSDTRRRSLWSACFSSREHTRSLRPSIAPAIGGLLYLPVKLTTTTGALTLASQESMSVSASPRCGWSALPANREESSASRTPCVLLPNPISISLKLPRRLSLLFAS